MKLKYIGVSLVIIVLCSCSALKPQTESQVTKEQIKKVQLTDVQKRKFDYFFYEASREKMKGNYEKSAMYLTECLKIDATSSAAMYELANLLVAGNEAVKAQGLLERAIAIEPNNIWYKLMLAELYQSNKMGFQAIKLYEQIVNDYPDNDEYLYGLAQLYQRNGEEEKAISTYNKLEKSIGLNEVIILEKEKILLNIGKNKSALEELNKLTAKYPEEARYYGFIGDYYLYLGDNDNAKTYYNKVLDKDPKNVMAYFSLGNIALQANDTTGFTSYYKKGLAVKSTPFEVKFQRILPFLMDSKNIHKYDNFLTEFMDVIIEAHPYEAMAYVYKGNYYRSISKTDLAIDAYKTAITIEPSNELIWQDYLLLMIDNPDYSKIYGNAKLAITHFPENAFFYLLAGSSAGQLKDNDEALRLLNLGLKHVIDNKALEAQLHANIGDIYYANKESEKAFESYKKSLEIDELNIVVLNNYSYYLSLENKDLDKAERMSSKCVELEPGNSTYLDTYAWVLFKRERYFEAKYIIERALDNGGNESSVIVEHYGDILYKNGDVEGAVEQWNKAVEMGTESETILEKIKQQKYLE
ncbi:tetratricopeptide repeat protein [Carboxylicivirga sediminis]|uniref:Tetratricopeptide repeat protein n=1 Tax=Carboxylicivirga sediminis TaxID=2006564 RepID=A0A941F696_9BACT|nr:tetratricopeptide repeat protein [Carboxylicivirga sediminis]MBR8537277.1 tetratricopeptide repeat protein [Carboxylicivirga sediminis]